MPHCPSCQSTKVVKNSRIHNGRIHNGKQNHKCRDCSRQFVENSQQKIISSETKRLNRVLTKAHRLVINILPWGR